jgi:hypothetical protein
MTELDETPYILRDYCIIHNIFLDTNEKRSVGKKISHYCKAKKIEGFKEGDICAIYPAWVLDQYFKNNSTIEKTELENEELFEIELETENIKIEKEMTTTINLRPYIQNTLNFGKTFLLTESATIEELQLIENSLIGLLNRIKNVKENTIVKIVNA